MPGLTKPPIPLPPRTDYFGQLLAAFALGVAAFNLGCSVGRGSNRTVTIQPTTQN